MEYQDILYEVDRNVATITINRPKVHNAFRLETLDELIHAFKRAEIDREVGVIVLTGAGGKAFSSGGDVKMEDESDTAMARRLTRKGRTGASIGCGAAATTRRTPGAAGRSAATPTRRRSVNTV